MSDLVYKNYLFTSREIMVLSALAGMEAIPLPTDRVPEPPDEREVELTVFELYQKGVLRWNEEGACELEPEVRTLFQDIKGSGKILQIYSENSGGPLLCFWNDYAAVMEKSRNDEDMIRVHSSQGNMFLKELSERGILPERDFLDLEDASEKDNADPPGELLQICAQFLEREGGPGQDEIWELLRERDEVAAVIVESDVKKPEKSSTALILNCGFFDYIAYQGNGALRTERYTAKNLKNFFCGE